MNIFQEAKQAKQKGYGYTAIRTKIIWQSKIKKISGITIDYGIRRSNEYQILPIWNTSNNLNRSLMFGLWLLYFRIAYHRKKPFNQDRKFLFRQRLWKFYQLFF